MHSQQMSEMQAAFGEKIDTLRASMDSKLLTKRKMDSSDDALPTLNDYDACGGNGYGFVIFSSLMSEHYKFFAHFLGSSRGAFAFRWVRVERSVG